MSASELKLLSSNAMTDVMGELLPEFERKSGHKVTAVFEPTSAIVNRLKAGETGDVIILIRQAADDLASAGKVVAASETDLARTSLGIAVREGAPKPDISAPEALKATLLKANTVASSQIGASGVQFNKVIERLGIADEMKPKMKLLPGAVPTASLLSKGEADIAVQMISELSVSGAQVVGPLPGDLHFEILLTGAVDASAKEPGPGADLLKFLASPDAAATLKKKGMVPASERPVHTHSG